MTQTAAPRRSPREVVIAAAGLALPCSSAEPTDTPRSYGLLIGGLGLKPIDKVLDLERRLVCRLCYAKEQTTVSIKWKAAS